MEQIKHKIDALEFKLRELRERQQACHREIGEKLYPLSPSEDEPPQCAALRKAIFAEEEAIRKKGELQEELETLVEEEEELIRLQKDRRQELRVTQKANLLLYENIGRAGFQAYREGTLRAEGLDSIFAPLIEQKEKINTYEVELKGTNGSASSFFNKIARRSRNVILKGNQSLGLRSMAKTYQKAGEALSQVDDLFYEEIEPLKRAFTPLLENRAAMKILESSLARGESRAAELTETLKRRDASRFPKRRIAGLRKEGDILKQKRLELLANFGGVCVPTAWAAENLPKALFAQGEALDRQEVEIREEQERLEKSLRQGELAESLKKLRKEKAKVELALEHRRRELEDLDKDIQRVAGDLEALERDGS